MIQRYVSNELTHFVGRGLGADDARYDQLIAILRQGILTADPNSPQAKNRLEGIAAYSYSPQDKFSDDSYSIDCVCFCDIPVPDLALHMAKYSRFGLSFDKPFLVKKGANPVFYWAENALTRGRSRREYLDDMVANFHWLIDRLRRDYPQDSVAMGVPDRLERLFDFVNQYFLCFTKLFDDQSAPDAPANYYMEREWRVAGSVVFAVSDVRRVVFPQAYAQRFRADVPEFFGQVHFV